MREGTPAKRAYVSAIRGSRAGLVRAGLLPALDRWAGHSRTGLWARSLLSIYDLEDLLAYDVPWWTFAAAHRVAAFLADRPEARVFEWGSGASTAWLARRAKVVTSVEHDPAWAAIVRPALPRNATVRVVEPVPATGRPGEEHSHKAGFDGLDFGSYVAALDQAEGVFDLIVVDGRARAACFRRAVTRLSRDGVLVFDNVDRRRYRAAIAGSPVPVETEWTRGLTPALPYPTRTALVRLRG
ncbi:MAG: class I SAM-dependent methyltransferase [Nocardioides sp.]